MAHSPIPVCPGYLGSQGTQASNWKKCRFLGDTYTIAQVLSVSVHGNPGII